jgi:hypothetical protein
VRTNFFRSFRSAYRTWKYEDIPRIRASAIDERHDGGENWSGSTLQQRYKRFLLGKLLGRDLFALPPTECAREEYLKVNYLVRIRFFNE